jgi:hypothetical protein
MLHLFLPLYFRWVLASRTLQEPNRPVVRSVDVVEAPDPHSGLGSTGLGSVIPNPRSPRGRSGSKGIGSGSEPETDGMKNDINDEVEVAPNSQPKPLNIGAQDTVTEDLPCEAWYRVVYKVCCHCLEFSHIKQLN